MLFLAPSKSNALLKLKAHPVITFPNQITIKPNFPIPLKLFDQIQVFRFEFVWDYMKLKETVEGLRLRKIDAVPLE